MNRIWEFLKHPQNLAVIVAFAGGLGFLWQHVFAPKANPAPPSSSIVPTVVTSIQRATAVDNSNAIAASGEAQVVVGENHVLDRNIVQHAAGSVVPVKQDAQAGSRGTAITAADKAKVVIKQRLDDRGK